MLLPLRPTFAGRLSWHDRRSSVLLLTGGRPLRRGHRGRLTDVLWRLAASALGIAPPHPALRCVASAVWPAMPPSLQGNASSDLRNSLKLKKNLNLSSVGIWLKQASLRVVSAQRRVRRACCPRRFCLRRGSHPLPSLASGLCSGAPLWVRAPLALVAAHG